MGSWAVGSNSSAVCNTGLDFKIINFMRTYLTFFIISFATSTSFSQGLRLNVYGHYVFDDKVESYYSPSNYFHGTIKGGALWGGGAEFRIHDSYGVELLYLRQNTTVPVHYYDISSVSEKSPTLDMNVNWILTGGMRSERVNEKVEAYGGFLFGVAILDVHNPENQQSNSATKFGWGLKAGCNIWVSEKVGIKLQAQLLSAVQAAGGSLYVGTGGTGGAVTGYSSMLQFSLGGGLCFRLRG